MDQTTLSRMVSFIWGIADDVLGDLKPRGSNGQGQLIDVSQWVKPLRGFFSLASTREEGCFMRHFDMSRPLRMLEKSDADILAIENAAEGRLDGLLVGSAPS